MKIPLGLKQNLCKLLHGLQLLQMLQKVGISIALASLFLIMINISSMHIAFKTDKIDNKCMKWKQFTC